MKMVILGQGILPFSGKSHAEGISEICGCGNNGYSNVHP